MNGNSSKRIAVIDIAKGIGILLVIAGHILPRESAAFLFIYSFHMPLFFILIGIVTDISGQTSFKAFLAADKKLMVSYVFWSLAFFIFDVVVRCLLQGYVHRVERPVLGCLADNGFVWNQCALVPADRSACKNDSRLDIPDREISFMPVSCGIGAVYMRKCGFNAHRKT